MSSPAKILLHAVLSDGTPAKTHQASEVARFEADSRDGYYVVITVKTPSGKRAVKLITKNGEYILNKHPTQNYFLGECRGYKVHVSLKKIVGEIRHWN